MEDFLQGARMSLSGKLAMLFAPIHILMSLLTLVMAIHQFSLILGLIFLFILYFMPVLLWRVLNAVIPLREGKSNILDPGYNPWWISHQLQMSYMAYPFLESTLRLVPGLYSFWLNLWGSKIGSGVHWTPGVSVYDRSLLIIGDGVIIGERASFVSHVITPKNGEALLMIKKCIVDKGAFIGAGSVISPGCHIKEKSVVKAGTEFYPNCIWSGDKLESGKIHGMSTKV
jgi:acetyltransferase-like isoleucine patch superfamily enzyme